jgi:hypothetical protein
MKALLYTPEQLAVWSHEVTAEHLYEGTPFRMQVVRYPEDKQGHWPTSALLIYRDATLLGGYRRLYPSFPKETFAPFEWKGQWYALYSANYTCTRVLRLNDDSLEDWCGEEPSSSGFCPAEFYTPQVYVIEAEGVETWCINEPSLYDSYEEFSKEAALTESPVRYTGFAFLAGCQWGDDSAWKLRYIDYSKVEGRVLKIDERFGYFPLANGPLSRTVDLSAWEPNFPIIKAAKLESFCIRE